MKECGGEDLVNPEISSAAIVAFIAIFSIHRVLGFFLSLFHTAS